MRIHDKLGRMFFSSALVAAFAASSALPAMSYDDHAKCQRTIERQESKLDHAIRKHGANSRQADNERRKLNAEREQCWNRYHGWWNAQERRWHDQRDWENGDRDRDHDRH
jgi:hypothetical protein